MAKIKFEDRKEEHKLKINDANATSHPPLPNYLYFYSSILRQTSIRVFEFKTKTKYKI